MNFRNQLFSTLSHKKVQVNHQSSNWIILCQRYLNSYYERSTMRGLWLTLPLFQSFFPSTKSSAWNSDDMMFFQSMFFPPIIYLVFNERLFHVYDLNSIYSSVTTRHHCFVCVQWICYSHYCESLFTRIDVQSKPSYIQKRPKTQKYR